MRRILDNFGVCCSATIIILLILQTQNCHGGNSNYEVCDTNDDSTDKRNDFTKTCEDICDGKCMQPVNYEAQSQDKDDQLFCQCKKETCTEATPGEGDEEADSKMSADCRSLCANAGMNGYLLCEPSDGAAFSDSVCACNKMKIEFECNLRFERACASICNAPYSCQKTKKYGHYCLCYDSNPISNNDLDNNYECEPTDLEGGDEKMRMGKKKMASKMKKCIKHCQKVHEDEIPYFCTVTDKGKRTTLPKHVCACSMVS